MYRHASSPGINEEALLDRAKKSVKLMPSKHAIKRIKDKLRWEESKADRSVQLKAYYEQNKEVILESNQTKYCNNPTEKRSSS